MKSGNTRKMATPSLEEVRARLQAGFLNFPAALQGAARYVTDHPDAIAMYSMRSVASQAKVSPTTMIRLAKELGFDNYSDLRTPFQESLRHQQFSFTGHTSRARQTGRRGDIAALAAQIVEREVKAIQHCLSNQLYEQIEKAVEKVKGAERVYVIGMRASFFPAFYYDYASRLYSDKTVLIDGSGYSFADKIRYISDKDVLLAFTAKPYARVTQRAINYAAEQGARIVCMTDDHLSPATAKSDVSIVVPGMGPAFFPMVGPVMICTEILLSSLLLEEDELFLTAVKRAETQMQVFEESVEQITIGRR